MMTKRLTKAERALIPQGFEPHTGGKMPVDPEVFVETLIRTADGIGSGGVTRARLHEWKADEHANGIGAVVGYRLVEHGADSQRVGKHERLRHK